MKYDFSTLIDRQGWDAMAVDRLGSGIGLAPGLPKPGFDPIPMWVADMNFATLPSIQEAILQRVQHPLFGYFDPSEDYYKAILRWQQVHNGVCELTPDCIGYENGVLGGVISALNVFCSKGDPVLVHAPTYIGFTNGLRDNGYRMVLSPLQRDAQGIWRMDYEDMEEKLASQHIHAAVFCSPHNPSGRVWERWELEKMMELFCKYDVMVVSDEIWSDLTLDGAQHIPTQSVSEDARQRTVALYAPSKTFNLAGLVGSYRIVYNKTLQDRLEREAALSRYNNMNVLSMHALIGAYSPEGDEWLEELRQVLSQNVHWACDYIREQLDGVEAATPQGTYMLFLDCTDWCRQHHKTIHQLIKAGWDVGVAWQDGTAFHGPCHIRMNLALPFERVQEAFYRLKEFVFTNE